MLPPLALFPTSVPCLSSRTTREGEAQVSELCQARCRRGGHCSRTATVLIVADYRDYGGRVGNVPYCTLHARYWWEIENRPGRHKPGTIRLLGEANAVRRVREPGPSPSRLEEEQR